jgi:putative tricarboxylic transport membrane protein
MMGLGFESLAYLSGGVFLGIVVGAVPGLTATLAIALLLPFTFSLPPETALLALTGIYVGGIYGGSITAITIGIPGAPANTMTLLDGYPMARAGRAEEALGLATFSSFVGGVLGGVVLVLAAPQLARIALRFQSPETFSLILLALVAVASVSSPSGLVKGLASTTLGLMLATVGLDSMVPVGRFTFGASELLVGIPLLPIVIGLFAVTEVLSQAGESDPPRPAPPPIPRRLSLRRSFDFVRVLRSIGPWLFLKSAAIGAFVGALPGAGAAMSAFLAYSEAKRTSKHPERFGTGTPEGVAAPETANNAMTGGAFVPMLALGIPGDAVTAVILGGLLIQGLTPGPMLMRENRELMTALFTGYFVAYVVMLVLGLALVPWVTRLATVRRVYLLPFVLLVSLVAAYASERTPFAIYVTIGVGVLGTLLRRLGYPLVPLLLGALLGPPLESNFRRALIVSDDGPWVFLRSPVSAALLLAAAALALYPRFRHRKGYSA